MHKWNNCLVKTRCFKLDWFLGLGCVEEWRFPNTYQTLQLPSSGWRNLESKQTVAATHSKKWDTALSWTDTKQGLAPAFPFLLNSHIPTSFEQQLYTSYEDHTQILWWQQKPPSTLHTPSPFSYPPDSKMLSITFLHNSPIWFKSFIHVLAKTLPSFPPSTSLSLYFNREDTLVG